jgi:hypothetical protein
MPAALKEITPLVASTEQIETDVGEAKLSMPLLELVATVAVSVIPGVKITILLFG